jgi:hypothetical protein
MTTNLINPRVAEILQCLPHCNLLVDLILHLNPEPLPASETPPCRRMQEINDDRHQVYMYSEVSVVRMSLQGNCASSESLDIVGKGT